MRETAKGMMSSCCNLFSVLHYRMGSEVAEVYDTSSSKPVVHGSESISANSCHQGFRYMNSWPIPFLGDKKKVRLFLSIRLIVSKLLHRLKSNSRTSPVVPQNLPLLTGSKVLTLNPSSELENSATSVSSLYARHRWLHRGLSYPSCCFSSIFVLYAQAAVSPLSTYDPAWKAASGWRRWYRKQRFGSYRLLLLVSFEGLWV